MLFSDVFWRLWSWSQRSAVEVRRNWWLRYLEMLLSMGYGGGGVQWEEGTRGSCGCSACVGLSELMSAFMGRWEPIMGVTAETKGAKVSLVSLCRGLKVTAAETWQARWGWGGRRSCRGYFQFEMWCIEPSGTSRNILMRAPWGGVVWWWHWKSRDGTKTKN